MIEGKVTIRTATCVAAILFACALGLVGVDASRIDAKSRGVPAAFTLDPQAMRPWLCDGDEVCIDSFSTLRVPQVAQLALRRVLRATVDMAHAVDEIFAHVSTINPHKKELLRFAEQVREATRDAGSSAAGVEAATLKLLRARQHQRAVADSYPYFGVVPHFHASAIPGGGPVTYTSPCFASVTATAQWTTSSEVTVSFTLAGQKSLFCTDHMVLGGGDLVKFEMFDANKEIAVVFNMSDVVSDPLKKWYLSSRGIKIMRFRDSFLETIVDLVATVTLLSGFAQKPISNATFAANYEFMRQYVQASEARMGPKIEWRDSGAAVARSINTSTIESGDAMLLLRPDGLDPMIGWGEGATVGHSVVFLRDDGGALHVCESTTLDAYWPVNGIQCNPWERWRQYAEEAEMNVVLLHLSPKYRAVFNRTAAWRFFSETVGTDYGYQTFLFGWLDTKTGNDPCLPPDYTTCLVPQLTESLALLIDGAFGNNTENFFRQALNHRVGTWGPQPLSVMEVLQHASEAKGLNSIADIYVIPEQDDWQYHTTRNGQPTTGRSMVCCVFVCSIWKAAGVFVEIGGKIQCSEQTLWDIYSMKIFDGDKMGAGRPQVCREADPGNALCQLMGNFTLNLQPDVNTRTLYKNMGERCTSTGPDYIREPGC